MSRMESAHQSSQAPTALPSDVVSALHTLHEFVATAMAIPPQIIVTCREDKRAFGRAALQAMSYRASAPLSRPFHDLKQLQKAVDMFITRFATKEDWWISEFRYKPEVTIYGRFYRQHGDDDDGMVILDERGWSELVGNVVRLTIVFTSLKFSVTAYVLAPMFGIRMSSVSGRQSSSKVWSASPANMIRIATKLNERMAMTFMPWVRLGAIEMGNI